MARKPVSNITVYDKDGGAHVMSWANARDLVKNCGWSLDKPATSEGETKGRGRGRRAASSDDAEQPTSGKPDYPCRRALEHMKRSELIALAKDDFDYALDPNRKTDYMVWVIQRLRDGLSPEDVDKLMAKEFGANWGLPNHFVGDDAKSPASVVTYVTEARPIKS